MIYPRTEIWHLHEYCPIEISELLHHADKFMRLIRIPDMDEELHILVNRILDAKVEIEHCRQIIKSLIEPETNKYVRDYEQAYALMIENLGRYDRLVFDAFAIQIAKIEINQTRKTDGLMKIKSFTNQLLYAFEHLVYMPIKRASERFYSAPEKNSAGLEIAKDADFFCYCIFLHLYHASESLGVYTRDDKQRTGQIESTPLPDTIPKNARVKEPTNPEEVKERTQAIEDFFKTPEAFTEESYEH